MNSPDDDVRGYKKGNDDGPRHLLTSTEHPIIEPLDEADVTGSGIAVTCLLNVYESLIYIYNLIIL